MTGSVAPADRGANCCRGRELGPRAWPRRSRRPSRPGPPGAPLAPLTIVEALERCYEHYETEPTSAELHAFAKANGIPLARDRTRSWASTSPRTAAAPPACQSRTGRRHATNAGTTPRTSALRDPANADPGTTSSGGWSATWTSSARASAAPNAGTTTEPPSRPRRQAPAPLTPTAAGPSYGMRPRPSCAVSAAPRHAPGTLCRRLRSARRRSVVEHRPPVLGGAQRHRSLSLSPPDDYTPTTSSSAPTRGGAGGATFDAQTGAVIVRGEGDFVSLTAAAIHCNGGASVSGFAFWGVERDGRVVKLVKMRSPH